MKYSFSTPGVDKIIYYHWYFPYIDYLDTSLTNASTLKTIAKQLKILAGLPLDNDNQSPTGKELSKLIQGKLKTCAGWKLKKMN